MCFLVGFREAEKLNPNLDASEFFYTTFYNRLFDIAPDTKQLFKNDIKKQGIALFAMISVSVGLLSKKTDELPILWQYSR